MLQQDKLGWGVYAYYMGSGGSFDYSLKRKQGVHAALRTLLEYSIIELIGKYFEVPYWRCIPGANADDEMLKKVRDNFVEKQKNHQHLLIKKMLFLHGFNGIDRENPEFIGNEEGDLKEAMRRTSTSALPDLYLALWRTVPIETASRRVMIDRRKTAKAEELKAAEKEKAAAETAALDAQKKKEREDEQRKNVELFNSHIGKADQYYQKKQYKEALSEYDAAHRLFGGEEYPVKMINAIKALAAEQQAAAEKSRAALQAADEKYRAAVHTADNLYSEAESASFNYGKYKKVLQAYEDVLKIKPDDKNAAEKVRAIKEKLSKYSNVLQKENGDNW
jgi:tetratricopeptide (TPR) repeat protein